MSEDDVSQRLIRASCQHLLGLFEVGEDIYTAFTAQDRREELLALVQTVKDAKQAGVSLGAADNSGGIFDFAYCPMCGEKLAPA